MIQRYSGIYTRPEFASVIAQNKPITPSNMLSLYMIIREGVMDGFCFGLADLTVDFNIESGGKT
jgi:hypothetical protein